MKKLIPGVYYVRKIFERQYTFNYWTMENIHVAENLKAMIPVNDQRTYDVIVGILDRCVEANGFVNESAYQEVMDATKTRMA